MVEVECKHSELAFLYIIPASAKGSFLLCQECIQCKKSFMEVIPQEYILSNIYGMLVAIQRHLKMG